MESKIVELRERSQRQVRRARRTALIAAGAGAAIGVAVVGAFVVYRLTRPATPGERARRLIPPGLAGVPRSLRSARLAAGRRLRERMPPVRVYVGDRQLGEQPRESHWERLALRAAQAAGTAAAGAIASRLLAGLTELVGRRPSSNGR